jgi:hypothetical protein
MMVTIATELPDEFCPLCGAPLLTEDHKGTTPIPHLVLVLRRITPENRAKFNAHFIDGEE